jgi:DNA repair exonuclease SbcCD nuclease subunit
LGDIMHYHDTCYVDVFARANDFLVKLSKMKKTYVLMGNHDYKSNRVHDYKEHFFNNLNSNDLIIIDKPTLTIDGIYLCPYVREGYLWDVADKQIASSSIIAFFHQEFKGSEIRPGVPSEIGDEWPAEYPLAVSGHIHTWHMPAPNICYTGTPFQHNFSVVPERKTVSMFDNSSSVWEQTRIDLKIPSKVCVRCCCAEFANYEYDGKSSIKFKIVDTTRKLNIMRKSDKYIKLSSVHKVKFLLTSRDEVQSLEITEPKTINTYWDKLKISLSMCDKHVQDTFYEIMRK